MLFELTSEFRPAERYDVCIIGAGAAGIVAARKLARAGHSVFLAEGGGLEYSDLSQSIYRGDVIGAPYFELDIARLCYFGGTTNHWSGVSRPLDARGRVGTYFTEHPHFRIGEAFLYSGNPFHLDDSDYAIFLTPTLEFMERSEILSIL